MNYSAYNIFSKIKDSNNYFIINLLSGNADLLTNSEAEDIRSIIAGKKIDNDFFLQLKDKGYLADPEEEKRLYRKKYLEFLDSREKEEIQLFFITNYSCNFSCSYCYQDQYLNPGVEITKEVIDSFFTYIETEFAGRKKYITVFGGEPLLDSPKQRLNIEYLIEKASLANLEICFVTNGYTLSEYTKILEKGKIREIQVTLDGTENIHNVRRHLKGGGPTFRKIVEGIDACLEKKIPVNLRMVADMENINNLPELSMYAIDKRWTKNAYFKTQIGRNYELHHCQSDSNKLFDRISLYETIYEIIKKHPHVSQFYKPAYSISKFLFENGELPEPLFDSCPACKTEWAFDYTGSIYPCTATVGKEGESLGTFFPVKHLKSESVYDWEKRDITSIKECRKCNLQLACGGGCGSVAKNRSGQTCSSDCRPVKELLELGFSSYFD
jgi:uncharacterized protein